MEFLEWFGAMAALFGALTIALKRPVAGYLICIASCLLLSAYFVLTGQSGLLVMQLGFLLINVVGLYNWSRPASRL